MLENKPPIDEWFTSFPDGMLPPCADYTTVDIPTTLGGGSDISPNMAFIPQHVHRDNLQTIPGQYSDITMEQSPSLKSSDGYNSGTERQDNPESHLHRPSQSNRRRAQNRAAQRAFRERKEKKTKDLEVQLSELTVKYNQLQHDHSSLQQNHEKLQQTLELLSWDDSGNGNTGQLRQFIDIIQGKSKIKRPSPVVKELLPGGSR